ncbi:MAG: hypothetical protein R3F29_06790 [Planctomycetota bacterium]
MNHASLFFLSAICLGACATNHHFPDRSGAAPDVAALEQARLVLPADDETRALGEVRWLPLLNLHGRLYEVTDGVGFPAGTSYSEVDSYGPLFCVAGAEVLHYDADQQLYEREQESSWIWGLYRTTRSDVLTPHGWRVRADTRLLFGLLHWPSDCYTERAPFDPPPSPSLSSPSPAEPSPRV